MRQWRVSALAVALLLAPLARASPIVVPSVSLEGDWSVASAGAFAYVPDAAAIETLVLHADALLVHVWEERALALGAGLQVNVPESTAARSFSLENATLRLQTAGDHAGGLGVIGHGACSGHVADAGVQSQPRGHVGSAKTTRPEYANLTSFSASWDTPMLRWSGMDALECAGDLYVKLYGPDVVLESATNSTPWTTGRAQDGPASEHRRWLVLEGSDVQLRVVSPMDVATPEAQVAGEGALLLPEDRKEGELVADLRPLAGALLDVAILAPEPASTLGGALRGDAALPSIVPFGLGLLVAGLVVGGAALRLATRARREADPDALAAIALAEAEADRFESALEWSARARAAAPSSRRLLLDEAGYLAALGRIDEALGRCGEAAALAPDGEPHLVAARLLALAREDAARVEDALVAALERSPELVLEVEEDAALQAACARPDARAALARARRRLGR